MVQLSKTLALPLAYAALAHADNTPPPVPQDAQIGILAFPVTCKLLGFINQTFDTVFTATAPVFGGTGEEIYYTDVVGHIDIPSYITGLAPIVAATQASADITVYLNLINASPASLLVYKNTINNISFPAGGDASIRIPPEGTLPPLGPVTLGAPNVAHRILLGDISVVVNLQKDNGDSTLFPIDVSCGQQNIDFILGSVDVNSTSGLPPASPSVGYVPSFPPTPDLDQSGSFRFPYDCTFGDIGAETVDLTIGGTLSSYFAPGESFYVSNVENFLRVPASLVSLATKAYPDVTTFDTTITTFDVLFSNADPSVYNAAGNAAIESSVQISNDGSDLLIPIPSSGYLPDIGPIVAGANGDVVGIAVGNAVASTVLRDASGKALFTLPITCSPPSPLELIGVPITDQTPADYKLGFPATPSATSGSS